MKNILKIIILIGFTKVSIAQNSAGKIVFERKTDWVKIRSKATYLSQEQKDRMAQTWKNDADYKQKMVLNFNPKQSYYTYENKEEHSEDGTYNWENDQLIITRDFEKEKIFDFEMTRYNIGETVHKNFGRNAEQFHNAQKHGRIPFG